MPDVYAGADALRFYLTGASSDGGAQTDPNASLGNYRSSTRATSLGISVAGGPANITVDYASGANGTGAGSVSAESADTLAWTPPGGSKGDAVTIANGETKILVAGSSHPEDFVEVSRTSATALSGTATVTLSDQFNNVFGLDNVSTAEQAAGDTEYRCFAMKNVSSSSTNTIKAWLGLQGTVAAVNAAGYAASGAVTVTIKSGDYDDWPDSGFVENENTGEVMYYTSRTSSALTVPAAGRDVWTDVAGGAAGTLDDVLNPIAGIRIAKEAPASQATGAFTDKTVAGEGSQPAGLTWKHPTAVDDADVISIGDLATTYIYGLWVERAVIAAATAEASVLNDIRCSFEAL